MDPLVAAALMGVVALAPVLAARIVRRARRARVWRKAAESCGVTDLVVSGGAPGQGTLRGRFEGLPVKIGGFRRGARGHGTRVVIETSDSHLAGLRLRGEDLGARLEKMTGSGEIATGDSWFDERFFVEGVPTSTLAFLDAEMRRLLVDLQAQCRVEIANGRLHVEIREASGDLENVLPRVLYQALEIVRRWPHHDRTAQRLSENALRDPEVPVRLHNLVVLVRELREHSLTTQTLQAACLDPWPEIRLQAARALGSEGRSVLFTLAESEEDDVAAQAVRALGRSLTSERALAILDGAVARRNDATACACIGLLGRIADDAAMARLAKILEGRFWELRVAVVQALGTNNRPEAEALLLNALRFGNTAVRFAAADSLGQVGGATAVPALKDAAQRDDSMLAPAGRAIALIQSRLEDASPGQLSMAEGEAGQVSLAPGDAGRLSLPEGKDE